LVDLRLPAFAVPVDRAQDLAKSGPGKITLSPEDPLVVIGEGTKFTELFKSARAQIMLPRELGGVSSEVTEVIDDTHLRLKKEFSKKAADALREKPSSYKVSTQSASYLRK
jgi:glycerol-3-phosphate O-acyltransferase/dihydroxyacetone phosphate acyltransferase